jgi:hypothetical protein
VRSACVGYWKFIILCSSILPLNGMSHLDNGSQHMAQRRVTFVAHLALMEMSNIGFLTFNSCQLGNI